MQEFINSFIINRVETTNTKTNYRTPLVGFTRADNPGFFCLRQAVSPGHLLPGDLLPEAKTVAAFFIPFSKELVAANRKYPEVSYEWALAYVETNNLISNICQNITEELQKQGVKTAWQRPTHNYDPVELTTQWSHKHIAYFCGLGTFGLHRMLITRAGCAGRFGSLVLDAEVPPTPLIQEEYCLYYRNGKCKACTKMCPTGALETGSFDKHRCNRHLYHTHEQYGYLGTSYSCGKCAVGPCATSIPGEE